MINRVFIALRSNCQLRVRQIVAFWRQVNERAGRLAITEWNGSMDNRLRTFNICRNCTIYMKLVFDLIFVNYITKAYKFDSTVEPAGPSSSITRFQASAIKGFLTWDSVCYCTGVRGNSGSYAHAASDRGSSPPHGQAGRSQTS